MRISIQRSNHNQYKVLLSVHMDGTNNYDEKMLYPLIDWCHDTGIGRRVGYDQFAFRSESDASAFMLRWNGTELA